MKKFESKIAPVFILLTVSSGLLVPLYRAQDLGSTVQVSSVPDGGIFSVDGQNYTKAMSAIWPTGSKHVLSVQTTAQDLVASKTKFTFNSWESAIGVVPGGNIITVTAAPGFTFYHAHFTIEYALSLVYFTCSDPANCPSPGVVFVNGKPFGSSADVFIGAGGTATLSATPNDGWVFTGWLPGPGQNIQGSFNTVAMTGPMSVYPVFQRARNINLTAVPPGLALLADRTKVPTPTVLQWGYDTTHTLGVISPQLDINGKWWAFKSWSDGGASTHAYKVGAVSSADNLTATFVAGSATLLTTTPPGLSLKIDGKDPGTYSFIWGVGETHQLEAPAQQTDGQGRIWKFASWSNGAPAVQSFTVPASGGDVGVRLNATYSAVGHLTVSSLLPGLTVQVDGQDCITPCDVQRPVGSTVRVSVPASIPMGDGARADFMGWPGSGTTAADWAGTLNGDAVELVASYRMMNHLAASATPSDGASWNVSPSSPDGYYEAQTIVNVGVTAKPGYRFHAWSGDLSGTKPAGAVAMTSPRSVQAQLDRVPYIAPTGVTNGAGTTPGSGVAPGSVATIFGASLTSDVTTGPASPLAQTLGGVTVRVGDRFMPLFFVSPTQINFQIPDDLGTGDQRATVSSQGLPDVQATFTVVRNAPGIFANVVKDDSFAVAVHEDGSAVTADSPARRGELLTLYGTGFGPTDHSRPVGFAVQADPPLLIVDAPSVMIGDGSVAAENAFAVPGRVAIDAVQFRLGDTAPTGTNAPLFVRINGRDSNTVLLPIQ